MMRFPIAFAEWLRPYDKANLAGDLNAGITVGVMLIPQGLAYALIAGLPPIYGLYAALIPLMVYALFGSSGQLAVGPVAMVSLLVAAGVSEMAEPGSDSYLQLAIMLAFLVGVIQLVLGLLRFGFVTNFLSHPVLSGFTSAAALIIGMAQLKHLVGFSISGGKNIFEIGIYAVQNAGQIHLTTLSIGIGGILVILAARKMSPKFPGGLLAVILATGLVFLAGFDREGVAIVGHVPAGLPSPSLAFFSLDQIRALLPIAFAIALVGFMESIAVAKAFASKNGYTVDPSQELVALGLANVAGSFFRSFPTTGGFSRSAVNHQAGSKTGLSSIISAVVVGLTLLFFTPLFTYLPNALLASIVIVAVVGLLDVAEVRYLWRVNRTDLALLALTFGATLLLGIEEGILTGVLLSVLSFVNQASRPHMAVLGRLPNQEVFRNVERFSEAELIPGIVVFRIDASLFFGNIDGVRDTIEETIQRAAGTQVLILDLYPVNRMDSTALHSFTKMVAWLGTKNISLFVSGVKGPVRDVLQKSGLTDLIGADHFFDRIYPATESAKLLLNPYLGDETS
jgi:sulfate permease, SulP family